MTERLRWLLGLVVAEVTWCSLAVLTNSPYKGLAIPLGLGAAVLICLSPHVGIYLMASILIGQWPWNLTRNLGLLVVGSAVGWSIIHRRRLYRPNPILHLMILYFVLVVLSVVAPVTRVELLSQVAMYGGQVALVWLFVNFIDHRQRVWLVVRLIVLSGVITAALGLVQAKTHFVWIMGTTRYYLETDKQINADRSAMELQGWQGQFRVDSITGTPDFLPIYMQSIVPIVAFWAYRSRFWQRMLWLAVIALMGVAHILSYTRGVIFTTLLVVLVLGWLIDKRKLLIYGPFAGLAGFMALMSWPAWRERLLTIVALSANEAPGFVNTGTWRLRTMVVGWQMMWNRPLFGYGVGQHQWNWPASTIGDLMPNPKYAQPIPIHNAFLGVGMDLGVGGMLLLIATIAVAFLQLSRIARAFDSAGQRDLGDLSRALGVAILGMGASMMLYPMAGTFRYYPLYLALAASLWRIEHEGLYHDSR